METSPAVKAFSHASYKPSTGDKKKKRLKKREEEQRVACEAEPGGIADEVKKKNCYGNDVNSSSSSNTGKEKYIKKGTQGNARE